MSRGISWVDVRSMTGDEAVHDLTAQWVDAAGDGEIETADVTWAGWDHWSVFANEVPIVGGLHRGGVSELILRDQVIWRGEAMLVGPQRMPNFIGGPFDPNQMRGTILGVEELDWSARRCLSVAVRGDAKESGTVLIDRATGWVLRVESTSIARGFETIRIDEGVRVPELGTWAPAVPPARPGVAYVSDSDGDRRFGCHVEVDAGPAGVWVWGPSGVLIDEALAWARERADRVRVRWGLRHFSGGRADLGLPPVPVEEILILG